MADPKLSERIVTEALSRFGSIRATIEFEDGSIVVERWHRPGSLVTAKGMLSATELDELRELALAVSQEEQQLVVGDFYADGEERLRIELEGHRVELHNGSDRIRTPKARPLLLRCWELAERVQ